jgi:hypothetical protein
MGEGPGVGPAGGLTVSDGNANAPVPRSEWEWFGNAGHFICASDCRFHLCTKVGPWLVSTVGEYVPDSAVQAALRQSRKEVGMRQPRGPFEQIGCDRTYETMVFRAGQRCAAEGCGCDLPQIVPTELAMRGYDSAGDAARGHLELCEEWAGRSIDEVTSDNPESADGFPDL